jgi:protein TonB
MGHLINNQQKMNDIIFAGRNKAYGAYAIRSTYGYTVLRSLLVMLLCVGSFMFAAYYFANKHDVSNKEDVVFIHDSIYVIAFNTKKEEEPKTAEKNNRQQKTPESLKSAASSTFIQNSADVENDSIPKNNITEVTTSTLNSNNSTGTNTGSISESATSGATQSVIDVKGNYEVDSSPEFEGGLPALYKFVSSHLRYPEPASDAGKQGTIYVKFVVDENGKIGNLIVLNNLGYGMDEEALRVVGMIPKFKSPAKIKGVPVKVYYQLPIGFRLR